MSHCNITMHERFSVERQQAEEIAILKVKYDHLSRLFEAVQGNLESIFERIRKGEEVYLDYQDGTRIHIQAAPGGDGKE